MDPPQRPEKIKLVEINSYLTCYLCKGYLIDATTISECLHSFCRSCIIKFLQENCYCPVCEVIINKAKPCLKLDKTLQDIVYKLVPELFVKEMHRRKQFYQSRPALAPKVSPEERGEDTERTIFNPQDAISLSIEYISDDSAPGAIPMMMTAATTAPHQEDMQQDNPMKRYLQCPGMCRIEVLKKFVRNKYNVDTNSFHIDILYKRVPLPDHYTLIDIGYIYSWKRNEPMKFFFRITDINKVAERFDYFDGKTPTKEIIHQVQKPVRIKETTPKDKERKIKKIETSHVKAEPPTVPSTDRKEKDNKIQVNNNKSVAPEHQNKRVSFSSKLEVSSELEEKVANIVKKVADTIKKESESANNINNNNIKNVKESSNKNNKNKDVIDEIKTKIQNGKSDIKNSVYTNITLNRDDNVEIITKIQKVSNKEGHPIGLNIINHTVKKTNNNKVQSNNNNNGNKNRLSFSSKIVPNNNSSPSSNPVYNKPPPPPTFSYRSACQQEKEERLKNEMREKEREEMEKKSNFLKSIELTAKNSLPPKTVDNNKSPSPVKINQSSSSSPLKLSSAQKRKNSSPVKNDKEKKSKTDKKPVKIIIQPKSIQNPAVRQIVTNVNQNVNNLSKIVEQSTTQKTPDIQTLIDNCKINIPSSLSITLNEGGETGARTPPSIPPVKNYIEILKLPEEKNSKNESNNNVSFQKIFEETLPKKESDTPEKKALDLTNQSPEPAPNKRKILEIASALQKKTKIEQEKKDAASDKIAIPRVPSQKTLKPVSPPKAENQNQTSASLHSSSLGLNYTVSVGKTNEKVAIKNKLSSPPAAASASTSKKPPLPAMLKNSNLSPNQILEKYNIQNLAQLTASFNLNQAAANFSALQHAMFLKHIERQNWLSLNQGSPLMQYEKYLQSLSATQSKIMGNIKEN